MAASPIFAEYERRLEAEGLASLDTSGGPSRRGADNRVQRGPDEAHAVEVFLAWARDVLDGHDFYAGPIEDSPRVAPWVQRRIWSLYAEGRSYTEMQAETGRSRKTIRGVIAYVRGQVEAPPVPNPWRKSGRYDERTTTMEAKKTPPAPVAYRRILLRNDLDVRNTRQGASWKKELQNVEGRPHAGGIDVTLETKTPAPANEPTLTTITVPWWMIKQADKEPVAVDG